jgi:hypothetical protein
MNTKTMRQAAKDFRNLIVQVRGVPVILDSDLAKAYGVTTGALNQAVKRNFRRFPSEFLFVVKPQEVTNLLSQIVIASCTPKHSQTATAARHGGRRNDVFAFTEHGALMASMVLKSPQAVQMSVFVVRAFVAMRAMLTGQRDLTKKLADLERRTAGHARARDFGYHSANHAASRPTVRTRRRSVSSSAYRLFRAREAHGLPDKEKLILCANVPHGGNVIPRKKC